MAAAELFAAELAVAVGAAEVTIVAPAADALLRRALAWAGEMVCVEVCVLLPLPDRTRASIVSGLLSMKAMAGPATIEFAARLTTSPLSGCESEVIQIATGPVVSPGTTHWLNGSDKEKGDPPASI